MIKSGTYKNWVKTGMTAGGKPIDKTELYYWTIFASLYKELFQDVDFKPLSYYSMKTVKYNVQQMQFTKELINKAYEYVQENKNKNIFKILFFIKELKKPVILPYIKEIINKTN